MSKYFDKYETDNYKYLISILTKLRCYGYFKGDIKTLENLWKLFSEECYCASFLIPDDETIVEFTNWLDNFEEDI